MTTQYILPLPHDPAMGPDDFMTTASNREAMGWVENWPNWPAPCLTVVGPVGSGKTHLMHVWLARTGGRLLTFDALLTVQAVDLVAHNNRLALDNAENIAGDAGREEALFHLYNTVRESGGTLMLTAQKAPAQWGVALPDLRSRLCAAPVAMMGAPDDVLLSGLLIKQFRDRQIDLESAVLDFILPRVERTPAAIRALVERLDHLSLAEGRKITIPLVRQIFMLPR